MWQKVTNSEFKDFHNCAPLLVSSWSPVCGWFSAGCHCGWLSSSWRSPLPVVCSWCIQHCFSSMTSGSFYTLSSEEMMGGASGGTDLWSPEGWHVTMQDYLVCWPFSQWAGSGRRTGYSLVSVTVGAWARLSFSQRSVSFWRIFCGRPFTQARIRDMENCMGVVGDEDGRLKGEGFSLPPGDHTWLPLCWGL